MRRWLLVGAIAMGLLSTSAPVRGEGGQIDPFAAASSCAATNKNLHVLMLIDESLSLQSSDPHGNRRALVRSWFDRLWSEQANGAQVRFSLYGYGSRVVKQLGWQTLDENSYSRGVSTTQDLPANQWDTDHALAITSAAQSLAAEATAAARTENVPCLAMLWFTDGAYDFEDFTLQQRQQRGLPTSVAYSRLPLLPSNEGRVKDAGLRSVCSANGGPVSTLRSLNTAIVAIALDTTGKIDFRDVQEIATGDGYDSGTHSCDLPPYHVGAFFPTTDPTPSTTSIPPVATEPPVSTSVSTFLLNPPTIATSAHLEISAKAPVDGITISLPSGPLELSSGSPTATADSVLGRLVLAGGQVSVDVRGATSSFTAPWSVAVTTTDRTVSLRASFATDVRPRLRTTDGLVAGQSGTVAFELADPAGIAIPQAETTHFSLSASLNGSLIPLARNNDGRFSLNLTAAQTTSNDDQIPLVVKTSTDQAVTASDTLISVGLRHLDYPTVDFSVPTQEPVRTKAFNTPGATSVHYRLIGPALGSGCVTAPQIDHPFGESTNASMDVGLNRQVCLAADTSETHTITIQFPTRVYGTYCQQVTFDLTSATVAGTHHSTQAICVRVDKSANLWTTFWAVVLMLMFFVLPLALMAALNWFNGKLPRREGIRLFTKDLRILRTHGGSLADDGTDLLNYQGFSSSGFTVRNQRTLAIDGVGVRITAYAIRRPDRTLKGALSVLFGGPEWWLQGGSGYVIVGFEGTVLYAGDAPQAVKLPLNLTGCWVVHCPSSTFGGDERHAKIYVLRDNSARGPATAQLSEKIGSAIRGGAFTALWPPAGDTAGELTDDRL